MPRSARRVPLNLGPALVAKNLHLPDFLLYWARILPELTRVVPEVDMNDQTSTLNDDAVDPAARAAGHQPALTGCPWHDVNEMLQAAGLRPTRQRMALGWLLFGKGARHLTAEMLYEEATLAKVPVSLATVYNTLNQLTDAGLLRQVSSTAPRPISTPTSPRIITSISRTTTSWSISPIRIWCCRRCRKCRKVTRSPASTWSCGCARSAELICVVTAIAGTRSHLCFVALLRLFPACHRWAAAYGSRPALA